MAALDELKQALQQALAGRPRQLGWGQPQAMSESLEALRQAFGQRRGMVREQRVARGVMAFRILGGETDFVHLKYACQGLALPMDWESRRLIEDVEQVNKLLLRVRELRQLQQDSRRFAACYRGLLQAWERAAPELHHPSSPAATALRLLADFLRQEHHHLPLERAPGLPAALAPARVTAPPGSSPA